MNSVAYSKSIEISSILLINFSMKVQGGNVLNPKNTIKNHLEYRITTISK